MLAGPIDEMLVEKGSEYLKRDKWNTEVAKLHCCLRCGIMTHHQKPTTPDICRINISSSDESDHPSFKDLPMNNGIDFALIDE